MVAWQMIIVLFVWIFIMAQFSIFSWLFLPLLYKQNRIFFWVFVPTLLIFFVLLCYSYYKTTFTNPGAPAQNINSFFNNIEQIRQKSKQQDEIKHAIHSGKYPNLQTQFDQIQSLQQTGYCFKCNKIKEVRTHHCSTCGQCVLRMDHHCPWVGTCVGKYNHKYFLLFLFYGSLCVILVSAIVFADFLEKRPMAYKLSQNKLYLLYAAVFSAAMIGIAVIFLFFAQIYMLSMNVTTIESFVNGMNVKQPFRKPTFSQNMQEIMGDSNWFIPSPPFRQQHPYHNYIQL